MATPRQIEARLRRLEAALPKIAEGALFTTGQRVIAEMKARIFDEGRAANGKALGPYRSDEWKAIRQRRGRQTAKKDLNLSGDMFRSFQLGRRGRDMVFGFTAGRYTQSYFNEWLRRPNSRPGTRYEGKAIAEVAAYQEQEAGEPIFQPTAEELRQAEIDAAVFFTREALKILGV